MSVIVLVCGGRDYQNYRLLRQVLDEFHQRRFIELLVHGNAGRDERVQTTYPLSFAFAPLYQRLWEGADRLAEEWAIYNRVPFWPYPVSRIDWEELGKRAGPVRNQRMLDERSPDVCIAFPGNDGTADMVRRARKRGLEVIEIKDSNYG
jgi:hypothetical protein